MLTDAGLSGLVEPTSACLVRSRGWKSPSLPSSSSHGSAPLSPVAHCLFVGESAAERAVATSADFRVSPHPLHALHLVESEFFAKPRTLLGKE
ncbi:hypothetical protein GCM10018779_67780 [Streptomyces griseocarneus]|nr:hypothetical protein GCM10018779_67780 [Streptomyces griseocarneus]